MGLCCVVLRIEGDRNYSVSATFLPLAARSRSITDLHPLLSSERCLNMQAVIAGMFGISELQRRNASPVHICCASALKAKLELDESAEKETAKATINPAWRIVLLQDAVILGSSVGRRLRRVVDAYWCRNRGVRTVMTITRRPLP
jgi:hypothetical protein